MAIIRDAAAEVDRPLFYAVVVIVASFLPIYVLTGPSGVLFKPMADTMIFALIGVADRHADIAAGALRLADAAAASASGATRSSSAFAPPTSRGLDQCLARPRANVGHLGGLLLALAAADSADVGAEFMPHLDEGALWVRATMPYTISFDESAKIVPQVRVDPRVLPRSDDGRLRARPARRRHRRDRLLQRRILRRAEALFRWHGRYRNKAELIDAINDKLQTFPGITFNYTQPAEDAVDEAETGLKSALAVKIFGSDLSTLETEGQGDQGGARARPRHPRRDARPGARPAEPRRSRSIAPRSRATGSTSTTSTA